MLLRFGLGLQLFHAGGTTSIRSRNMAKLVGLSGLEFRVRRTYESRKGVNAAGKLRKQLEESIVPTRAKAFGRNRARVWKTASAYWGHPHVTMKCLWFHFLLQRSMRSSRCCSFRAPQKRPCLVLVHKAMPTM